MGQSRPFWRCLILSAARALKQLKQSVLGTFKKQLKIENKNLFFSFFLFFIHFLKSGKTKKWLKLTSFLLFSNINILQKVFWNHTNLYIFCKLPLIELDCKIKVKHYNVALKMFMPFENQKLWNLRKRWSPRNQFLIIFDTFKLNCTNVTAQIILSGQKQSCSS